jgi:hypothetical protein
MTNPNFDWTMLLPEEERKVALARRTASNEAFIKGFPIQNFEAEQDAAELRQAGVEGRAAFEGACAIVDARKETERLLNAVTDHIAGSTPSTPSAPCSASALATKARLMTRFTAELGNTLGLASMGDNRIGM